MSESLTLVKVCLFGHFSVECRGHIITDLEARRLQEVFSYLLLNRHRRCSRELLASLFWGESSTEQSKRNLRQVLWQLQAALEAEKPLDSEPILCVTTDWLQINPNADLWVDVDVFEQSWNKVKHIPGKDLDDSKVQLLQNAILLHKDVLLSDSYADWCLRERERLLSLCIAMLEKLMEYSESHHDYEATLSYGARILNFDRAHEATHQQLIRLYYFLGRRIEALKQYHRCEIALLEELGASPSKSTHALYQRIFLDQLDGDPVTKELMDGLHDKPDLLANIIRGLEQVRTTQKRAQREIAFHIQHIEQTLHTLLGASEDTSKDLIPSEREKLR